jgi:hypothetical protein
MVTKVGAGYIHIQGTDYRCSDCSLFIPGTRRCAAHGKNDLIRANGYCIEFLYGAPNNDLVPIGSVTKLQSGYGEDVDGTKCYRCRFFNGKIECSKVDRNSPGDNPGKIHPDACCANQQPK